MKIVALRHGEAGDPDADQWPDDRDRPLTEDGEAKLVEAAPGLAHVAQPDAVLSSPATRTWQTAKLMHKHAGWPKPKKADFLSDGRDHRDALKELQKHSEAGVDTLGLVGHAPSLAALLAYLLTGRPNGSDIFLKKGGAVLIDYHSTPGNAELHRVWSRKDLARIGKG